MEWRSSSDRGIQRIFSYSSMGESHIDAVQIYENLHMYYALFERSTGALFPSAPLRSPTLYKEEALERENGTVGSSSFCQEPCLQNRSTPALEFIF